MESQNSLIAFVSSPNLTKEAQSSIAENLVAQVIRNEVDPIRAYVQIKAIAEVCAQVLKDTALISRVQAAADERGRNAEFGSAKVGVSTTTRYDYASSGDPQYLSLIKQKESIDNKIKAREMYLKAITERQDMVDRNTGEVITILPPQRTVSPSLRVTFAKA